MSSKMNFLEKAKLIHGDKYDYSLVEYKTNVTKVKIICEKHGEFEQTPNTHISKKSGCPKCVGKNKSFSIDVLPKLIDVHGYKYDYSKSQYKGIDDKIIIICEKHGEFEQTVYTHLSGSGCPKCRNNQLREKYRKSVDTFIIEVKKTHGDKYDYSQVNYVNCQTKVKILCKKHGIFEQIPDSHLRGRGCPICRESKGENMIRNFLIDNNIFFEPQKKFTDCRDIRPLPFDFYLPQFNTCIEFDGKQHESHKHGWFGNKQPANAYEKLIKHDTIKTDYCKNNNIILIRVNHKESFEEMSIKFKAYLRIEEDNNILTAKIFNNEN